MTCIIAQLAAWKCSILDVLLLLPENLPSSLSFSFSAHLSACALLQPLPRLSGTLQMADLWMSDRRNAIGVDYMQSIDMRRGMLTWVHGQDLLT